jgi:hypothetical protein
LIRKIRFIRIKLPSRWPDDAPPFSAPSGFSQSAYQVTV